MHGCSTNASPFLTCMIYIAIDIYRSHPIGLAIHRSLLVSFSAWNSDRAIEMSDNDSRYSPRKQTHTHTVYHVAHGQILTRNRKKPTYGHRPTGVL